MTSPLSLRPDCPLSVIVNNMIHKDFINSPAERVAVRKVWGEVLPGTATTHHILTANSFLDITANKTYSRGNSANRVTSEKIEGHNAWLLLLKFEKLEQQQFPCLIQQLPQWYLLELLQQMLWMQQPQSPPHMSNGTTTVPEEVIA